MQMPQSNLIVTIAVTVFCSTLAVASASNASLLPEPLPATMIAGDDHAGADAAISQDGKFIVTSSQRAGGSSSHLWLLDVDKNQWRQLTNEDGDQTEPQFSPAGTQIAYTSTEKGNKDIWVLELASGNRVQVTDSPEDDEYSAWSPDGKSLVYTGGEWKHRNHFIVEVDGSSISAPKAVLAKNAHVGSCSFFASSEKLLCHTYESGFGNIVVINVDGTVERRVTQGSEWDYKPYASSDGKTIAFSRVSGPTSAVQVMHYDENGSDRVIESVHQDRWPMFYDNNRRVFFHRLKRTGTKVVLWDKETSTSTELVSTDDRPLQAALDPSNRYLAYCAEVSNANASRLAVKVLDRTTQKTKTLSSNNLNACYPRWSPDGKRIALLVFEDDKWQLAIADHLGEEPITIIDTGSRLPNGFDGPIDWSPDSKAVVLRANTAAYESSLYTVKVDDQEIESLTDGTWYDDAPAWSVDGKSVSFMSTRGGGWTYGLFELSLHDRAINQIEKPNYDQKNYPQVGTDSTIWSQYKACDGRSYIVESTRGKGKNILTQFPGALWPSFSDNGKQILFTQVENTIEFWSAEL